MKKLPKITILFIFILLFCFAFILAQNTLAACPTTVPEACKATASSCGSQGYCGCDRGTTKDFSCMDESKGDACVASLCPGASTNKCCKAKTTGAGGTTTPTTTTGGTGGGGGTTGILPACAETGRCTVCDLLQVAINFGKFLFGIVGALVLLYFFYGGFLWLTSAGASEKIKKGKDVLVNSVIGLIIVFGAYGGVIFIVNAVTGGGFSWEANLQCAELPTPVPWTLPGAEQGAPQQGAPTGTGGAAGSTAGTSTAPTDVPCTTKAPCTDTKQFCNKSSFCQPKNDTGGICASLGALSGNANDMCLTNLCATTTQFCIHQETQADENDYCTASAQCKLSPVSLVCIKDRADDSLHYGHCKKKLALTAPCTGLSVEGGASNDSKLCETEMCSLKCAERP